MYQKVEDVKRPLKKGEMFLVPCIIKEDYFGAAVINGTLTHKEGIHITPILNHPHNDVENGQKESHYHTDYRFVKHDGSYWYPHSINDHSEHIWALYPRVHSHQKIYLCHTLLPVINEDFVGLTPANFIKKSKLKHNCIYKGKCPHRGFDLSQTPIIDGKITCPLHGLQFNAETGELLTKLNELL